jgi:hypothetical protein
VTFLETDIDCLFCLEDVRAALVAAPWVGAIEEEMSSGCLVVRHRGVETDLAALVNDLGHRLDIAPNGELTMRQATVSTLEACPVGHAFPERPGEDG